MSNARKILAQARATAPHAWKVFFESLFLELSNRGPEEGDTSVDLLTTGLDKLNLNLTSTSSSSSPPVLLDSDPEERRERDVAESGGSDNPGSEEGGSTVSANSEREWQPDLGLDTERDEKTGLEAAVLRSIEQAKQALQLHNGNIYIYDDDD